MHFQNNGGCIYTEIAGRWNGNELIICLLVTFFVDINLKLAGPEFFQRLFLRKDLPEPKKNSSAMENISDKFLFVFMSVI